MPQFEITKIQVLLDASLALASVDCSPQGFKQLDNDVSKTLQVDQKHLSDRYINERIYQQLKKANKEDLSKISLKYDYLHELAKYLRFESFFDFEKKYEKIKGQVLLPLKGEEELSISIIYDKKDAEFIDSKCQQSLYKNQPSPFRHIPLDLEKMNKDELGVHLDDSLVTLILLDSTISSSNKELFSFIKEEYANQKYIIPIWLDPDVEVTSSGWLTIDDFELLIQLLLASSSIAPSKKTIPENPKRPAVTNIRDSGTVNLGKIGKIKAEYISSRDMHININKDKSENK